MTGLDIFARIRRADADMEELRERILRRESAIQGTTARPLSEDGGIRGSRDASMRMADYVGDVEQLRARLDDRIRMQTRDMSCALYLADMVPRQLAGVVCRYYLDRMTYKAIGEDMHYSESHIKRLKRDADKALKRILILQWDGTHVPLVSIQ